MTLPWRDSRIGALYLAPWVDIGGSDKGTIDWFRFLDRDRFRPSLLTTQPSPNRRLGEIVPFADEVWDLPELMSGDTMAHFILAFIQTRSVKVVHIMNSRLGFELLPEMANLPDPPTVVVQLHVEETDRSGYVRYVTTRYGNLVDAFSVSSQALSDRLDDYEVPRAKRRLIRTGVDAEREFSPRRVPPIDDLDPGCLQILFPARLTAQKNPLLMVEVAARLRAEGVEFQIQALGGGDMMSAVHDRVRDEKLEDCVVLRGDQTEIAPWYAACDAVLLTSEYEGLPYVALEAMAMAKPFVGPDLPGLAELVSTETGILISARDGAQGYVRALAGLARDRQRGQKMGELARTMVLRDWSLKRMGAEHGALYDELMSRNPVDHRARAELGDPVPADPGPIPASPGLRGRIPGATPLVSVIVPCFNHGAFLRDCLSSLAQQDYEPIEVIVVDDGSTSSDTLAVLDEIERAGTATVLRSPANRGPSAARNLAIEQARGRYVLPVDADNILLPGAVSSLVDQLSTAPEQIGFIYPSVQYFGNRTDFFEPPSYNLHHLLDGNYCDTSSLIDREVLDRGFRYPEDVRLGHEDWDLFLSLAENGIQGAPAQARTLLCRKHGFTRSDLVEISRPPFGEVVARRHPALFEPSARIRIKAESNPALSVIALDPLSEQSDGALPDLVAHAIRQSCPDFELVIPVAGEPEPTPLGRRLRRLPPALATTRAQALTYGLQMAAGRWTLAAYGSVAELLADPTLIEKVLRVLGASESIDALALATAEAQLAPFRLLIAEDQDRAEVTALVWPSLGRLSPPPTLELGAAQPLEALTSWYSGHGRTQWRQLPRRGHGAPRPRPSAAGVMIGAPRLARRRDAALRIKAPEVPGPAPWPPEPWAPPLSRTLYRHYELASGRYVFSNRADPPDGCAVEHALGYLRGTPLAGTVSVIAQRDSDMPIALGEPAEIDAPELLGFMEQAPLPLLDAVQLARVRTSGRYVLVIERGDPLADAVEIVRTVGFIEGYPLHPRSAPSPESSRGLVGLVRTVDHAARHHRYGAGQVPPGRIAGELGALFAAPFGDCEPVWIDSEGRVSTAGFAPAVRRSPPASAIRWAGEPLTWKGYSSTGPKLRSTARRALQVPKLCGRRPGGLRSPGAAPAGYLSQTGGGRAIALYGSVHEVTGDQLLSTHETELLGMGYMDVVHLGYLSPNAPVTGRLGTLGRVGVPWARHFGLRAGAL